MQQADKHDRKLKKYNYSRSLLNADVDVVEGEIILRLCGNVKINRGIFRLRIKRYHASLSAIIVL